ncbi:MAG TPA: cation:proton antiporter, partial [Longimicrobiales bacterium]|nr:cation:proton antiporter [Longimicrobiales bacterium]
MSEVHEFLATIATVLVTAGITTAVCQRLRLPVVFGYLLAGFAIGPNLKAIPLVADEAIVRALSELGVILLMFTLGLEFSLRRLMKLLPTAGLIAAGQSAVMLLLGFVVGQSFGWSALESFFAGSMIAVASTTIVAKAFAEQRVQGEFKDVVIGILIVQDMIAILLLAVLTTAASGQGLSSGGIAVIGARLAAFLLAFVTVGLLLIPRMIRYLARLEQQETLMIGSVGIAFASSLAASFFGYSVALGAFLAGGLGAESGFATRVEQVITPVRDLFAAVFFVAVGMLIDPSLMAEHWLAIVTLVLVVILGNVV